MPDYVEHSLINPNTIERRAYQEAIANSAKDKNTLVVLPTGLGKCHCFDDLILLQNGEVEPIGKLVETALLNLPKLTMRNGFIALNPSQDLRILSLSDNGFVSSKIVAFCKFKTEETIEIEMESGIRVQITPEHPLLSFDKDFAWVKASDLKMKDWIIIAKKICPIPATSEINFSKTFQHIPGKKFITKIKNGKIVGVYCTGGKSSKNILKPVNKLTPDLARFLGLVIAEGVIGGGIKFYNDNQAILADYKRLSKNLFGLDPVEIDGGLKINSTALFYFLRFAFGMSPSHSRYKMVPKPIMSASDKVVSAFLGGLYDGEGSVRENGHIIEFMTASRAMARQLPYLLLRSGISCRVKPKKSKATNSPNPKERIYYRIYIEGKENLKLFERYIGFRQPERKEKLAVVTNSSKISNTNVDVFPVNTFLAEIRKGLNLVTSKRKDFTRLSDLGIYERGTRNPSRNMLTRILLVFEERRKELLSLSHDIEALNNFKGFLDTKKQLSITVNPQLLRKANVSGKQYKAWLVNRWIPKIKNGSPYMRLLHASGRIDGDYNQIELQNTIKKVAIIIRISDWEFKKAGLNPKTVDQKKLLMIIEYINKKWETATAQFKKIDKLKRLLQAGIAFDRIKHITRIKEPKLVYDICTEHGNFIAGDYGGLISHNTSIAALLVAYCLEKYPDKKILFLAPTKPLSTQHQNTFKYFIKNNLNSVLCTGDINPEKRISLYNTGNIIFSTPQTIKNDIQEKRVNLENFSLCVFDEVHRSVGDYAYTFIANRLSGSTLILGLTASPGGRLERIKEVLENTRINNIEIRTSEDADVAPYIKKNTIKWIPVDLTPALREIKILLDALSSKYARDLGALGFPPPVKHKGMFIKMGEKLRNMQDARKFPALIKYYALLNVLHMSELLETQGTYALRTYMEKVDEKDSKSATMLMHTSQMVEVKKLIYSRDDEHPKLKKLIEIVKSLAGKKMIVFAQYRDQIKKIEDELKAAGVPVKQFVGKKDGVTRKQQEETIAEFRDDKFNVLVASCIGEEGLDIPKVDAVIFYEPIPSEIRSIQRRGRAARLKEGEVHILMTRGTRDEYYYWSALNKEKKMKQILYSMQLGIARTRAKAAGLPVAKIKRKIAGQTKISFFT